MTNEEIEEHDFELQIMEEDEDNTCEICGEEQENNELWLSYDSHNNDQVGDYFCRECAISFIEHHIELIQKKMGFEKF